MYAFRQNMIIYLFAFILMICIVQSFRINELEHDSDENKHVNQKLYDKVGRHHELNQLLARRSFYDPAFGDSWSNYFERKRALFDPAYDEWANSFKRSNK